MARRRPTRGCSPCEQPNRSTGEGAGELLLLISEEQNQQQVQGDGRRDGGVDRREKQRVGEATGDGESLAGSEQGGRPAAGQTAAAWRGTWRWSFRRSRARQQQHEGAKQRQRRRLGEGLGATTANLARRSLLLAMRGDGRDQRETRASGRLVLCSSGSRAAAASWHDSTSAPGTGKRAEVAGGARNGESTSDPGGGGG